MRAVRFTAALAFVLAFIAAPAVTASAFADGAHPGAGTSGHCPITKCG
ncbi:hypothetical protein [Saccharothrix sp. NRRL B-16348]|jgi:hypothetical protein|nr:hypothetical protein [Saccharothrix sp. NRRL B-16348]